MAWHVSNVSSDWATMWQAECINLVLICCTLEVLNPDFGVACSCRGISGADKSHSPMKLFTSQAVLVLGLLCAARLCNAQDESAAIIQTTIMEFNVTGSGSAGNFSTQAQTDFSNNLRQLLNPFNFMSVAVSDYKVHFSSFHMCTS